MRALVLGAHGAVGRVTVQELERRGHRVTTAGRSRGDVHLDLRDPDGLTAMSRAARDHDVVVNTSGVEEPELARVGTPALVDTSATGEYLAALRSATPPGTTTVLGAGLVPGLSTVLLAALDCAPGAAVDLGVMLGTGEEHGAAAVQWTADLIGAPVRTRPESDVVHNFRNAIRMTGPDGRPRAHRRADFPDHELLAGRGIDVRSWLALTSPAATAALGVSARFPLLRGLVAHAPHVGSSDWHLVARERGTGRSLSAAGSGQSRATGVLTALAAERAAATPGRGAVTMADLVSLDAALAAL